MLANFRRTSDAVPVRDVFRLLMKYTLVSSNDRQSTTSQPQGSHKAAVAGTHCPFTYSAVSSGWSV